MHKLFIAVEIPGGIKQILMGAQPKTAPDMRLIPRENMHVTLLYIGEADMDAIHQKLLSFTMPPFRLTLTETGQFISHKKAVLWAGVRPSIDMLDLHEGLAKLLSPALSYANGNKYIPHITLARCHPGLSSVLIREFLNQTCRFHNLEFSVDGISLFSSHQSEGGVYYKKQYHYNFLL